MDLLGVRVAQLVEDGERLPPGVAGAFDVSGGVIGITCINEYLGFGVCSIRQGDALLAVRDDRGHRTTV
jgi:hypothetical protein